MTAAAGDAHPLLGRRVLVTRPRAQAAELVARLESAGAKAVIAPAIRIVPPQDPAPLLNAAAAPSAFDWIVFSSTNAVDAFLDAVAAAPMQDRLPRVCAVGSRTAERLRERGVQVDLVPAEFRAEALVEALLARAPLEGAHVLLPHSEIARQVIADGLRAAGAQVTDVVAYRTITETQGSDEAPDVRQMLLMRTLDAATFTSGSAIRNFAQMLGPDTADLLRRTIVAVIGPVTAEAARDLGITVHVQPATYTVPAMVDALESYFRA